MSSAIFVNKIKQSYPDFFCCGDESKYVYKYCFPNYFVVMKKLDSTTTNEGRLDIVNPSRASYRADKLEICLIVDMSNMSEKDSVISHWYGLVTTYTVGQITQADNFDMNISNTDSGGIHYFKSVVQPYYYGIPISSDYVGENITDYIDWYPNGSILSCGGFLHGERIGQWLHYFSNGNPSNDGIYNSVGKKEGKWTEYYSDSTLKSVGSYDKNGDKIGYWSYYDINGDQKEYEYDKCMRRLLV